MFERRYKIKCYCAGCGLLRIVTPLYPTTAQERQLMASFFLDGECWPAFYAKFELLTEPDLKRAKPIRSIRKDSDRSLEGWARIILGDKYGKGGGPSRRRE